MTGKQKADEIFTHYHNIIQEIGGELGQEILVSILAKQCALVAVDELIESCYNSGINYSYNFWQDVKKELKKL